eukprot:Skav217702  [mRNA]  locus=scaffold2294:75994:79023:- [translate_table: standard]
MQMDVAQVKVQWCSKGSAIVTYNTPAEARQAINALNRTTIPGWKPGKARSGRVFVRGFDFGTTDEQLQSHMSAAGEVADMHWVTRGSAVVIFKEAEAAKRATETLHKRRSA